MKKTRVNPKAGLTGSGFVADTYDLAEKRRVPETWWSSAATRDPRTVTVFEVAAG